MRRALDLARMALGHAETPVGAVVVRDGRVLGEGRERTRELLDPSAHAEVEAVRTACVLAGRADLSGATLYTTVEPCVLCSYVLRRANVARVVFGMAAGAIGGALGEWRVLADTRAFPGKDVPAVLGGVLGEECGALMASRAAGQPAITSSTSSRVTSPK